MSAYNGRRGPNVSEYIANLNTLPSAPNSASQQDFPSIDEELAMFTNTQFFDFDMGQDTDFTGFDTQPVLDTTPVEGPLDMKALEFAPADFTFPDFSFAQNEAFSLDGLPVNAPTPTTIDSVPKTKAPARSSSVASPTTPTSSAGLKRKANSIEDSSRAAAEEDKRRRNTAASARFRVKKKQREQALEQSTKEMADKLAALESKLSLVETENKWLKNLLVEKNENKDNIAELWFKYKQDQQLERQDSQRKDGVGTQA